MTKLGSGFIQYRKPRSKEYYIVRKEGGGDQCSMVASKCDNKPAGIVGASPTRPRNVPRLRSRISPNARWRVGRDFGRKKEQDQKR